MKSLLVSPHYRHGNTDVIRDADRLLLADPDAAYQIAAMYSWREDTGLLFTRNPGHWHRVSLEIGRRIGIGDQAEAGNSPDEPIGTEGDGAFVIAKTTVPGLSRLGMVILACFLVAPLAAAPFAFHFAYSNGEFNFRPLTIRKNLQIINAS